MNETGCLVGRNGHILVLSIMEFECNMKRDIDFCYFEAGKGYRIDLVFSFSELLIIHD